MTALRIDTEIDLLDLDRWARDGVPFDWFARLRAEAPVWRHPSPNGGPGFWVVSSHEHVTALGRCPHALSSDGANGGVSGLGPGDELQDAQDWVASGLPVGMDVFGGDTAMLLTLDPPEHTTYRKIVNKGFTPRRVALLEERIRSLTASLLDAASAGGGAAVCDFTTEVAMPLPMRVIGEMIGAPVEIHDDLQRWSNEAVAGTDPEYAPDASDMPQLFAAMSLFQSFQGIRDAHEAEPQDDLTTVLLEAEVDGESLSPTRFKMFLFLLALAGNETTRNAISHGVLALAENPDEWRRLRDDPSLIPAAVEEVVRWASPVLYFRRNALSAMDVAGVTVEPGDIVSLWYVSANRDEAVFDDPMRFDVRRTPNEHVAFGGGGPHYCLGASLARLEVRVMLEELFARYASIEPAGEPALLRSNFIRGIKHLPIRLVPG
jgi:cholest-4-en-3-one 26-monooxygenase